MTWADGIAAAILTAFALLTLTHQHQQRSTTSTPSDPQDGERP